MTKQNLSYGERAELCTHPIAKQLFTIMETKQTNFGLSADVTTKSALLDLAAALGPEICLLKTHIDIIDDFDTDLTDQLQQLAKQHNFVIFEDRKFCDIGNTVKHQYQQGIYKIVQWSDIINAHVVPGPGIIEGLQQVGEPLQRGLLLLAEMSSKGNLATGDYTQAAIDMAQDYADFVMGFISMRKLVDDPRFIHMTPGIQLAENKDNIGQIYRTPEKIIYENGSDIILVGRAVYQNDDPLAQAKLYRQAGWESYLKRL